jgi:4-hydroxybenzoate polyprenyltransferase
MVRGEHSTRFEAEQTLFALPFAVSSMVLAAGGWPGWHPFLVTTMAIVSALTAAAAFNHLAHPGRRPLGTSPPAIGRVGTGLLLAASSGGFILCCAFLNRAALNLSLPALALILSHSYTRRFTATSHLLLGACLAMAPLGAWIAIDGRLHAVPILLASGVVLWVAGFDIVDTTMATDLDGGADPHSVPAHLGIGPALVVSAGIHLLAAAAFAGAIVIADLGVFSSSAAAVASLFLLWRHLIVRLGEGERNRVRTPFSTLNGLISILLMTGILADVALR